jgi:hypothetical protein
MSESRRQHADEVAVLVEIAEREVDQPHHRRTRREGAQVELLLERADLGIGRLKRRRVEFVLAAEIVVDELLVGLRAPRDLVDARAFETARGELDARRGENGRLRRFRVAPVSTDGLLVRPLGRRH